MSTIFKRAGDNHIMVPGFGAQPKPLPLAANDNIALTTFGPLEAYGKRHGDFMQTFTGRKFWPMDPLAEEVFIEDIAHSLAMQCRYAGHCIRFYSVAEHSVLMARYLRRHGAKISLAALLHDASEAYLIDVPRPVKPFLEGYRRAEKAVQREVFIRFGLPEFIPIEVHDADERIIADELVNLRPMPWHGKHSDPLGVRIRNWSPEQAEIEFLATFEALTADLEWEVGE